MLALPGYSSHQNVLAYRKMRQSLAAIPHTVPLKPSHRRIDPAVSGPLQVGTHQQSLLQRVSPGRHPDHAMGMVLHPVQPFGIPLSHPHRRITGWSALRSGRLHPAHNLLRRKLSLPAKSTSVYLTLACAQTGPSDRVNQRDSRYAQQFSSPAMCPIGEARGVTRTALAPG